MAGWHQCDAADRPWRPNVELWGNVSWGTCTWLCSPCICFAQLLVLLDGPSCHDWSHKETTLFLEFKPASSLLKWKNVYPNDPPVKCVIWNKKSTVMRVKATVFASKCCFAGAMKIMEQLMVPPDQPSLTVSPSLPAGRSDEGSASSLPEVQSCWDESNIKKFDTN